jgi:hypothetical protein
VLNEVEAFTCELLTIGEGDVIVMFYDELEPVLEALNGCGAVPAATIGEVAPRLSAARV